MACGTWAVFLLALAAAVAHGAVPVRRVRQPPVPRPYAPRAAPTHPTVSVSAKREKKREKKKEEEMK